MVGAPCPCFFFSVAAFAALPAPEKALRVGADTARLVSTSGSPPRAGEMTTLRRWSTPNREASIPSSTPFRFCRLPLETPLRSPTDPSAKNINSPQLSTRPGFPVPAFLKSGVTDTQVRSFADAAAVYVNKTLGE